MSCWEFEIAVRISPCEPECDHRLIFNHVVCNIQIVVRAHSTIIRYQQSCPALLVHIVIKASPK